MNEMKALRSELSDAHKYRANVDVTNKKLKRENTALRDMLRHLLEVTVGSGSFEIGNARKKIYKLLDDLKKESQ